MAFPANLNDSEIVYVGVPRELLAQVYRFVSRAIAEANGEEFEPETTAAPVVEIETPKGKMIDLITRIAKDMDAEQHPVSLSELHDAYIKAYPGIGKGSSRGSFDATINYHAINMRSRFPDITDKHKPAYWLTRPVFKRIARAQYMLLTPEEIAAFHQAVERDDERIFQDEFDVAELLGEAQ
jgi:hypothetical protein